MFFYKLATVMFRFGIQFLPDTLIYSSVSIQFTVYEKYATLLIRFEAIIANKEAVISLDDNHIKVELNPDVLETCSVSILTTSTDE